jgi:RimJ/RimL family protein N-acetyltransferase
MGTEADHALSTARLLLTPLVAADAEPLAAALADPALWTYTGGRPETVATFRRRAADTTPGRLNWVVRTPEIAGYVQASVEGEQAWLAWVIGTAHQGHGYAAEAAAAVRNHVTVPVCAAISAANAASEAVARAIGLSPTVEQVGGERVWRRP